MATCQPYFYIIGWTKNDTWYAGCRYAAKATPVDFWKTYFTSSKHVKKYREENGEPDYKLVIPFSDTKDVLAYEKYFLKERFKLPNWLNKAYGCWADATDPAIAAKISASKKGWSPSVEIRHNMSEAAKKRVRPTNGPESYEKSAAKQRGVPKPQSEATKAAQKIRMKQWWADRKAKENGNV